MGIAVRSRWSPSGDGEAVRRFDAAMQNAVGSGLAIALVAGIAAAALGPSIYPMWWWVFAAPVAFVIAAIAVQQCRAGRFVGPRRVVFAVGTSASAAVTAVAAGDAVNDVGTAMLALVVMAVLGVGFLEEPVPALLLGGLVIVGDTVIPALLRPAAASSLLVQTGIQTLFLLTGIGGGFAARRIAVTEERAHRDLVGARVADRAATAARSERRELEREIHDTVLNTLAALGQASLDDTEDVRRQCAADARFLRTLHAFDPAVEIGLVDRLRIAVDLVASAEFPVALHIESVPADLPPADAATAMARAAREALRNARQHSGAPRAHVEVRSARAGSVEIRVVDLGSGVATNSPDGRLGVRRSLHERMDDVGGHAAVEHVPGAGTTVTLTWPRR